MDGLQPIQTDSRGRTHGALSAHGSVLCIKGQTRNSSYHDIEGGDHIEG